MAAIDIGPGAIDRSSAWSSEDYTLVDINNPANLSGKITSIEIWAETNLEGCKVGTFYGTPPNLTNRDVETIGAVTAGSKQTFSGLDCDVQAGDYIGIVFTAGAIEREGTGFLGIYWCAGDQFGTGEQTYTEVPEFAISLYGIGEETPSGWTGKISGVTNPAKVMGVEVANIGKVHGVS